MGINYLRCNIKILSRCGGIWYVGACQHPSSAAVTRILAALLFGAMAAGHSKAHVAKLSNAEFTKDGEPNLQSSGVLVLDPTTGQTLFAKNAETAAPIASLTKLMTAMVVLDANLNMDE